jgi:hypothetical protein
MRPIALPPHRPALVLALLAVAALSARGTSAVEKDVYREIRGRYEGLVLPLRIDLRSAVTATPPNTVSLAGIGYARETAPVIFGRLEKVYVQRVINDGKTHLELTIYRSRDEADRLRASDIPQPMLNNPLAGRSLAGFARQDSTSVLLEVNAGRKEPARQMQEIETLLKKVFYIGSEPSVEELEEFVRAHHGMAPSRLHALTGLSVERIHALLEESNPASPGRP